MKKVLVLILTFFSLGLYAQHEFAPIGAEWYYEDQSFAQSHQLLYSLSEGDTIILNDTCKVVRTYQSPYNTLIKTTVFKQEGGKIYYYLNNRYNLIYDYEASVGDTLAFDIKLCIYHSEEFISMERIYCVVQDIQEEYIDGKTLKHFFTQIVSDSIDTGSMYYKDGWSYDYMEQIGHSNVFMEYLVTSYPDADYNRFLRCYNDSGISFISNEWAQYNLPCDHSTGVNVESLNLDPLISIFPNPVENILNIEASDFFDIYIYDFSCKLIYTDSNNQNCTALDLSALKQGIYLLKISYNDGKTSYHKISKKEHL